MGPTVRVMAIDNKLTANGLPFPALGLGTWQMGGRESPDPNTDERAVHAAIDRAIDAGITHIDTAELYADGYSETLVGQALKNHDRSRIVLASKVKPANLGASDLTKAAEGSLRRLQTDYLDVYLIHRNNPDIALAETMEALDRLVERGLVRSIGVCNFSSARQAEAQRLTDNKLVCNQVHYNLIFREPEHDGLIEFNRSHGAMVSAWRPMQYGELSKDAPEIMKEMCERYDATPAQIAIAWLTSQDNVVTIVQTMDPEHLRQNIAAAGIEMRPEDIERLRNDYPGRQAVSNRIPLDS